MANMVSLAHPDFVEHKLGVFRSSIQTYLLYDGEKLKPNQKGQVSVLDDHGQERICQFEMAPFPRLPKTLRIDDGKPIAFALSTKVPLLAYPFSLLNLLLFALHLLFFASPLPASPSDFHPHGIFDAALKFFPISCVFLINAITILSFFGLNISAVKKCLYSTLLMTALYLIVGCKISTAYQIYIRHLIGSFL